MRPVALIVLLLPCIVLPAFAQGPAPYQPQQRKPVPAPPRIEPLDPPAAEGEAVREGEGQAPQPAPSAPGIKGQGARPFQQGIGLPTGGTEGEKTSTSGEPAPSAPGPRSGPSSAPGAPQPSGPAPSNAPGAGEQAAPPSGTSPPAVAGNAPTMPFLSDTVRARLLEALTLIGHDDGQAAAALQVELPKVGGSAADWDEVCEAFFANHFVADYLARFWGEFVGSRGEDQEVFAGALYTFVSHGLAMALDRAPLNTDELDSALGWLNRLAAGLNSAQLGEQAQALARVLAINPPDLSRPLLWSSPGEEEFQRGAAPTEVRAAMQTCLTLSFYASPSAVAGWVGLPLSTKQFVESSGIWLFDGGVLDPAQLASLDSLFRSVPPELHGVVAVLVPEGIGFDSTTAGLSTSGFLLDVNAIPMEVASNPEEFYPVGATPAAPEFTLTAAVGLMRAIQYVQFNQRPGLNQRLNTIISAAAQYNKAMPRRYISPGVYVNDRAELLPATAYLWFIDSEAAFLHGLYMMEQLQVEAMDTFLLLADALSGGGGETLLFQTDPAGRVSSEAAALRRVSIAPGLAYANGIGAGGSLWEFELGPFGSVQRYIRY